MPEYYITNLKEIDLQIYYCGWQHCDKGHSVTTMRKHYVMHYVKRGKGILQIEGQTYIVSGGQSFFIFPEIPVHYVADHEDPWEYSWIGFYGNAVPNILQQADISYDKPILRHQQNDKFELLFSQLIKTSSQNQISSELESFGLVYRIFSIILQDSKKFELNYIHSQLGSPIEELIKRAISFIQENYSKRITVSTISGHLGIERSYFTKQFKLFVGDSPYQFLLNYRLEIASRMLTHTSLPIKLLASEVGFEDSLYFSKVFRKHKGMSPTEFRKKGFYNNTGT